MKLLFYFLNFAFSKSVIDMVDDNRLNDSILDEMQNTVMNENSNTIEKRSLLQKRFEPTGWLSSMMAGAIREEGNNRSDR